jgi:hypothetical protein
MNSISQNNSNSTQNMLLTSAGVAAGWEARPYINKWLKYPVGKYIKTEFKNIQGGGFKPYIATALKQNKLENDLKVIDLNASNAQSVKKSLMGAYKKPENKLTKFILKHILQMPTGTVDSSFNRTLKGKNAFFAPKMNAVVCNMDKFGAPLFHEIAHKHNAVSKNILVRALAKIRSPLSVFGVLGVTATALATNKKDDQKKEHLNDKIKNNCGLLATLCVLPLTIEECMANIKGTKIAKNAGVTGELLKKVKKCHKISILSYCTGAITAGAAVWGANKLRDFIAGLNQPRKANNIPPVTSTISN